MNMLTPCFPSSVRNRTSAGGVLIEALVAIVVLSFGLLGMAGLQVNAMTFQKSSWITHRVSELVIDISEKIRSNPAAGSLGLYTYTSDYSTGSAATFNSNNCNKVGTSCTPSLLASDDIATWVLKAQTNLPQGSVQITGNSTAGYLITALWIDKESTAKPDVCKGSETGVDWRNCCPSSASVADTPGVKCYRANMIP
jgi:type IV pilus assembly protein PilV